MVVVRASDAADWGIAAFTGRSPALADSLAAQDAYPRAAEGDRFAVVRSLTSTHPGPDHDAWLGHLASPDVRGVTLTVTEAAYVRATDGGLDRDRPEIRADAAAPPHPCSRSTTGAISASPGPRVLARSRPKRSTTPRSNCVMTRTLDPSTSRPRAMSAIKT